MAGSADQESPASASTQIEMNTVGFLLAIVLRRQFWYLFLASFTMVVMLAWRQQLRDEIFHIGEWYSRGRRS
jgi:hypothetical protein